MLIWCPAVVGVPLGKRGVCLKGAHELNHFFNVLFGSTEGPNVTCDSLESQDGRNFWQATAACDPSTPPTIAAEQTNPVTTATLKPPSSAYATLKNTPTSQSHLNTGRTKRDISPIFHPRMYVSINFRTVVLSSFPSLKPNQTRRLHSVTRGSSQRVLQHWRCLPAGSYYAL